MLEYFEYFCQMSSKSIIIISSYTVSKLARFWDTVYRYVNVSPCVQAAGRRNQRLAQRTAATSLRRKPASSSARRSLPAVDDARRWQCPAGRRSLAYRLHRAQFDGYRCRRWRLLRRRACRLCTGRGSPSIRRAPPVESVVRLRRSLVLLARPENCHRVRP